MNVSPNKIYPAADSLIQCQGFYKWCMNKIFQDRLLKLVSIVNVDAVLDQSTIIFLKSTKKKGWSQTVPQTYQRDKPSNSFNSTFFSVF